MPNNNDKNNIIWKRFSVVINVFLAFFTSFILVVNGFLIYYTYQSNERLEKLFVGQNKPLIDVTPISIAQNNKKRTHSTTMFSVVNYSGFEAREIRIDVKYGEGNAWITKWEEANDVNSGDGLQIGHFYRSAPKLFITKLEAGKTVEKEFVENPLYTSGSLNLEKVCADPNGYPVFVRVTWHNEKGRIFDEIHKYTLICTKDSGRAFAFIPEGIISRKD